MFSVLYMSTATTPLAEAELVELLRVSRLNNAQLDITGLLLYYNRIFIQILEGPEDAVKALYAQIARDRRHYAIQTVLSQPIRERDFPNWSMGFQNIDKLPSDALPAFSSFLREPFTAARLNQEARTTYSFLRTFRKSLHSDNH